MERKEIPPGREKQATGCESSGACCHVQHRREWPETDEAGPQGVGTRGTLAAAFTCCRTEPPPPHTKAPAWAGVLALLSPSVGKGSATPLDADSRSLQVPLDLMPTEGAGGVGRTKHGQGQSSEPHRLSCCCRRSCDPGHFGGGRGVRGPPRASPARSHPSSASATGQLRMWTIYTSHGGQAAGGTRSPVAICGHDQRCAGLPGGWDPEPHVCPGCPSTSKSPHEYR